MQAMMPVAVFTVGCGFGTEKYNTGELASLLSRCHGVVCFATASSLLAFALQVASGS